MAVLTGIRLDRFKGFNEMRNIDAKIEGIGFLIAKNEGELENLRIPIGGIVKLQDTGKMLERTASGWKDYEMGGGSVGGGVSEYIQGVLVSGSKPTWEQTDEEKALNAELFKKIIDAYDNREPVTLFIKTKSISQIDLLQSVMINSNEVRTILNIVFILALDYFYIDIILSESGDVSIAINPMIPS